MPHSDNKTLLFVYGSLRSDGERSAFLNRDHKVHFLGAATARGVLYDLGGFVGLIDDQNAEPVHGELYEVIDEETFFETLDVIEGYWPQQQQRSLYVRKQIPVQSPRGTMRAWAYVFNQPVNGFPIVSSGDSRKMDAPNQE